MFLNPHMFVFFKEGQVILWDTKNHQQFDMEEPYIRRLIEHVKGETLEPSSLDEELLEAGLLLKEKPASIEWKWDDLSLFYHLGTRDIDGGIVLTEEEWIQDYLDLCAEREEKPLFISHEGPVTLLPPARLEDLSLKNYKDVLFERMTTRCFDGSSLSLQDLSTLLKATFGNVHGSWTELLEGGFKEAGYRRTSPSGGGLHPVEGYLIVQNVEGLERGVYHYDIARHGLTRIGGEVTEEALEQALCGQFFGRGMSVGIWLVGHFQKVWDKYPHSRSYKDVYLDGGHVSQTLLLNATALNMRTWITGWYRDSSISSLLNLKNLHTAPLFFIALGHGPKQALPQKFREK